MTRTQPEHVAAAGAELDARAVGWIFRWVVLGALIGALAGGLKAKAWWLFGWDLHLVLTKWVVIGTVFGGFLAGIIAIGVAQKVMWRREQRRTPRVGGQPSAADPPRPRTDPRSSRKRS